ncbi:hypothetical protein BRARA_B03050 [Brassica rapa]|uniref:Uncharacterized protein n=1 Tax=Brassica campestris TaxID=3711 RepID=A0A398AH98_BRACM|nr:hypothetical protein BRARA_B03050 [Brassica rapa]
MMFLQFTKPLADLKIIKHIRDIKYKYREVSHWNGSSFYLRRIWSLTMPVAMTTKLTMQQRHGMETPLFMQQGGRDGDSRPWRKKRHGG